MTDEQRLILSPTATAAERAIDRANAETLAALPVHLIRWVKNPDLCPAELLPWLAWERSVDTWNTDWTEQEKRDAIKRAPFIHRHRGTAAAVRRALVDSPFGTEIIQWFEQVPPGDPYTFRLNVQQQDLPVTEWDHQDLKHAVMRAKNLRSWFSVHVFGRKEGDAYIAGYMMSTEILRARIFPAFIRLSPSPLNLGPGDTQVVNVTVLPTQAEDKTFTVTPGDETLVTTVHNGDEPYFSVTAGDTFASTTVSVVTNRGNITGILPVNVAAIADVIIRVDDPTRPVFQVRGAPVGKTFTVDFGDGTDSTDYSFGQTYNSSGSGITPVYATRQLVTGQTYHLRIKNCPQVMFGKLYQTVTPPTVNQPAATLLEIIRVAGVTSLRQFADRQSALHTIHPGALRGNTAVTDATSAFAYCAALTSLPAGLFAGFRNILFFTEVFSHCSLLAAVPEDTFAGCTSVTALRQALAYCSALTDVPETLFRDCRNATDFGFVLSYNAALKTIPDGLFATNINARDFSGALRNTGLTAVPENLFATCPKAVSFAQFLAFCNALVTVPENLFVRCPNVTSFAGLFDGCANLTDIPAGLFTVNESVLTFSYAFRATALTTIPDRLFASNLLATSFVETFRDCKKLTTVPGDLLTAHGTITTLTGMFSGCTLLTDFPASALSGCTSVTVISNLFASTGLIYFPSGIFDVMPFTGATQLFAGCSQLTTDIGAIFPAAGYGATVITSIFTNCQHLTGSGLGFIAKFSSATQHNYAFNSCTGLSDYNDIPVGWK